MTIKQYAAEQGITPQAVYQRLKANKIKTESLTEKGSGEITGEGLVILNKLFDPENKANKPLKDERIEALEQQIAALRAEVATKDERLSSLTAEVESLKEDKEYLKQALTNEQNALSGIKALLPAPDQQPAQPQPAQNRRLTWRERIRGKIDSSSKG